MNNRYTSGDYLKRNPDWHEGDSPWKARQIKKILDQNNLRPSTVCEVGCGAGRVLSSLQELLDHDVQFVGYDISPQAIERAKTRQNDHLTFFCEDVLVNKPEQTDVLIMIDLIEHVEDYFSFLRAVKPLGTHKILHIPLDLSVQSLARMKPILNQRSQVGHIHYFTKEIALVMLAELGYQIIDSFYTGATIDLPAKSLKSRLMRLPRKLFFAMNQDLAVRYLGGYSLMILAK
ncbi:MAG: methyltransferase domain-containing protein [Patescibacteria group bacterium]